LFKKHTYQRKYKFIDKKQQVRFAVDVALHSLLFPIFLLLLMILPPFANIFLGNDAVALQPILRDFYRICWEHKTVVLFSLVFVGVFSVLFSHRVFGPIRRFENALKKRRDDPSQPIRCNLRGGDYFQDFSKLLEDVVNGKPAEENKPVERL
jgi:hypothetical protein